LPTESGAGLEPFRIAVSDAALSDLRARLAQTRFPDQIEGSSWTPGTDVGYLRELCEYWRNGFDWRRIESELNRLAQFTTELDGQRVHFVHERSGKPDALPLLLLNGWPSTFAEFSKVIAPLRDADVAFHLVVPSLPGYGFSGPTHEPGWTPRRMARAFDALMQRLGYTRYGVHGGDWGAMIASQLGGIAPERVTGIHLGMVFPLRPREGDPLEGLTEAEKAQVARMYRDGREERGYQQIQSTRPQTLAAGLNDSPAGLAAWIVEKFRAWSDCGGDVEQAFTRDELLTCISIYWFTQTIHSSMRLYWEAQHTAASAGLERVPVPMGHARFPGDGFRTPRRWAEQIYDVRHWVEYERGGHFPALEVPELLVDDLRAFFGAHR
jgi:microsomal epoxide hydrolase